MRILDVAQSYVSEAPTDIGGIFIHEQFKALASMGWDIRVINPQAFLYREWAGCGAAYPRESTLDGIRVWRPRHFWLPRILNSAGLLLERAYWFSIKSVVPSVTNGWRPQYVIADWLIPGGYSAFRLAKSFRCPLILRARGHDVKAINRLSRRSPVYAAYYRNLIQHSQRVICQGNGLKTELSDSGLCPEDKLAVLTNGIDLGQFNIPKSERRKELRRKLELPTDATVILFAGRWEAEKGVRELTKALSQVVQTDPGITFVAVGPVLDTRTKKLLADLPLDSRFIGALPRRELALYMQASDIFVLPSYREGLPNALLEAMACGMRVIATPVGGVPSVLEHNSNGLLVELRSDISIEQAIRFYLAGNGKSFGAAAHETIARGELSQKVVLERLTELILSIPDSEGDTSDL